MFFFITSVHFPPCPPPPPSCFLLLRIHYKPKSSSSMGTLEKPRCSGDGSRSPAMCSFSKAATAPKTRPTGIHFCSSRTKASRKLRPTKSSTSNMPKINPNEAPIKVDILRTSNTCFPFSTNPPPDGVPQHAPKHQFNKSMEEKTKAKQTAIPRIAYSGTLTVADHLNSRVSRMKHRKPEIITKPAKTVSNGFRATLVPLQKIFHITRAPMRRNSVPKYCFQVEKEKARERDEEGQKNC